MELCSPDLEEVGRIVRDGLKGHRARVYLFGSWVRGQAGRTSDIDVAVLPLEPLPAGLLSEIREALEESHVIYPVDLVDLSESTPQFRERVLREGVLWNG
jgi:predicted nucleotidyltransferase